MEILTLLEEPHPLLRKKSVDVQWPDTALDKQIQDIETTLAHNNGYAIAAPQVSIHKRFVVFDTFTLGRDGVDFQTFRDIGFLEKGQRFFSLINPKVLWTSPETDVQDENCFSVNMTVPVKRPLSTEITFQNPHQKSFQLTLDGFMARCFQHELDHLNGILTLDYLSPFKRGLAKKKLLKQARKMAQE